MAKVVFLCKGSRGDVHPVLSVAIAYKRAHVTDEVVFVCSPSPVADFENILAIEGIKIESSLPDVVTLSDSTANRELQRLKQEACICRDACSGANLIIFNLFSMEGYFIAQELKIPCIAVSLFVLARTPPTGFEEKLEQALPDLYKALKSSSGDGETVSYAEVDHWMWRLFLDDYGSICDHLGLSSTLPFSTPTLPPPTPLLYGVSSLLSPRQPYWPKSVQLCGYWYPPAVLQHPPHPELVATVESTSEPLVYIGFGSMESFMVDVNWTDLLSVLDSGLREAKMEGIFQCKESGPAQEAFQKLANMPQKLKLWNKEASHQWLFEKCAAVMHHGGTGTVATSLLAKRPQLVCPVMFDQEYWAEVIVWKNLGLRLSPAKDLTVEELSGKLKQALNSDISKSVDLMHTEMIQEDGVSTALKEIEKVMLK